MRQLFVLAFGLFLSVNAIASTSYATPSNPDSLFIVPDQDSISVCEGTDIQLRVENLADQMWDYSWTPSGDFDNPNIENPTLTPSASQWYYVTGVSGGATCTDSIFVRLINPTFSAEISVAETDTICPETRVEVVFQSNEPITSITWMPGDDEVVDPTAVDTAIIKPLTTTEYIVTAQIGNCERSDTFTINVIPFELTLLTSDTVYLCLPDTSEIRLDILPNDLAVVWSPIDPTINVDPGMTQAMVFPTVTTDYSVFAEYMGCQLTRNIHVRVDSLPNLDLVVLPEKDPYCSGDEVIIFAQDVDTMKFPDLEFMWQPMDGQIQDSFNTGNVFIITLDTTTFIRFVTNNACMDSSLVTLNVIPPEIPLSVNDTTLCPGDKFRVEVLDPDVEDLEWSPEEGLSCTKCFDPQVTVNGPMTYMVMGMKEGCPVGAQLTVNVYPPLPIIFQPSVIQGCVGDEIQINIDTTGLTNLELSVDGGSSLSCSGCFNPVLTIGGSGNFTVVAEESIDTACGAFGGVAIIVPEPEQAFGGAFVVCPGVDTEIDLNGMGFLNPRLSINNGSLSCNTCLNPTIQGLDVGTTLTVTSDDVSPGFCVKETRFNISVPVTGDQAEIIVTPSLPGQGSTVQLELVTNPLPDPSSTFAWVVNGVADNETSSTITSILDLELNVITVTWINSDGCPQTLVDTIPTFPPMFTIPNAFTPNGDDMNESFRVRVDQGNITVDKMLIFNRWGQLVFEGEGNPEWDGTHNGEDSPPEVYGYLIRLQFPNEIRTFKGDVTLIR